MNFYNDICKDACAWTRELIKEKLIPDGDVSDISITDIKAHELTGYTQCHFFSGVAGWPLAFQLAGVPDDENADTGSCPCQPFSGTGKQMGFSDPRHLWPAFRRVIGKRQPSAVYGEQVASKLGREWLSRVFSDLAFMGYAGAGADLCSAGVGSPNIRQRLYWVGDTQNIGHERNRSAWGWGAGSPNASPTHRLANPASERLGEAGNSGGGQAERTSGGRAVDGMANPYSDGWGQAGCHASGDIQTNLGWTPDRIGDGGATRNFWSSSELLFCRDARYRRIEPGSFPLANGIPSRVGPLLTELRKLGRSSIALARANRNIRLKGYGNAINPIVAAQFVATARGNRTVIQPLVEEIDL